MALPLCASAAGLGRPRAGEPCAPGGGREQTPSLSSSLSPPRGHSQPVPAGPSQRTLQCCTQGVNIGTVPSWSGEGGRGRGRRPQGPPTGTGGPRNSTRSSLLCRRPSCSERQSDVCRSPCSRTLLTPCVWPRARRPRDVELLSFRPKGGPHLQTCGAGRGGFPGRRCGKPHSDQRAKVQELTFTRSPLQTCFRSPLRVARPQHWGSASGTVLRGQKLRER